MRGALVIAVLCLSVACSGETKTRLSDFDALGGYEAGDEGGVLSQYRRIELLAAECMAEHGFDYEPHDPGGDVSQMVAMPDDERTFRLEYGYGITTVVRDARDGGGDHISSQLETMSDADREAWLDTFWGESRGPNREMDDGCQGQAVEEAGGGVLLELSPLLEDLRERVESDPRMVAAVQEWSSCMADEGYSFSDLDAPGEHISDRYREIAEETGDPDEPLVRDEADVEAVRAEELAIAEIDQACRDEFVVDHRDEVEAEYEVEFIEENRELLEELPEFGNG